MVIMHPTGMAAVLENPQPFSTVHSFEQAQDSKRARHAFQLLKPL